VADTEEKAQELGAGFVYGGGQNAFSAPQFTMPPGYNSREAIRRLASSPGGSWLGVNRKKLMSQAVGDDDETDYDVVRQKLRAGFQKAQANYQTLVGTPDSVIEKVKTMLTVMRPGTFIFFGPQGPISNEDRMRNVELLGKYVMPEIKAFAEEIGLNDPFSTTPGEQKLRSGESRGQVVDRTPLQTLGLR
jgi:alkanesulfonate monooxygenase SsuD/methylene tetrahydromethanopterin reductase-like flavin-dependent oxidoreductase (luciferase family)